MNLPNTLAFGSPARPPRRRPQGFAAQAPLTIGAGTCHNRRKLNFVRGACAAKMHRRPKRGAGIGTFFKPAPFTPEACAKQAEACAARPQRCDRVSNCAWKKKKHGY